MIRLIAIVGVLLLLPQCGGGGDGPGVLADGAPNIVLITVDTLRADHLGCYGYGRDTSPRIDALASEGLLFERCYSHSSTTWASTASLMSGFLPHETRVVDDVPVPVGVEMLAERLAGLGYDTVGAVGNFVLRLRRGYDQGFRIYDAELTQRESVRPVVERTAVGMTDAALGLLDQVAGSDAPFFAWFHYQDPHGPYTPPAPYDTMFLDPGLEPKPLRVNEMTSGLGGIPDYQVLGDHRDFHFYVARYDGEIRHLDDQLGRLLDGMKERGLYDDTLIVLTADHGESMGEHDFYFVHGQHLYEEALHVPLIIKHGDALRGRRLERVQHLDVVPTILSILGQEPDDSLRGRDLRTPSDADREHLAEMRSISALEWGGFKMVYVHTTGHVVLHDLASDPLELVNMIGSPAAYDRQHDLLTRLKRSALEDRLRLPSTTPSPMTPDEIKKLEALGYTGH